MSATGLRQLQDALNRKADSIQREFIAVSERIAAIGRELPRIEGDARVQLLAERESLHARQEEIADEVNAWRERAKAVTQQRSEEALRAYLSVLLKLDDETVRPHAERALYLLDASPEELARLAGSRAEAKPVSPAGRLIERARSDYDLRGGEPAPRQRAAVEFANRPGMAQDEAALAEVEAAMGDPDPIVREVATLTTVQLHRFRALRMADLDLAHQSIVRLTRLNHPAVVPILIEVLENPRATFRGGEEDAIDSRSRMAALSRLVEWHTSEAQAAVRKRQFDRDSHIARVAARALELFPGEWAGPLPGTAPPQPPAAHAG